MNNKIESNSDLINDLMNYSPAGAMSQIFIMDAINKQVDLVILNEDSLLKKSIQDQKEGKMSYFSIVSWIATAKDLRKRIDEFYNRRNHDK